MLFDTCGSSNHTINLTKNSVYTSQKLPTKWVYDLDLGLISSCLQDLHSGPNDEKDLPISIYEFNIDLFFQKRMMQLLEGGTI